jgi:hypothetical protein
MKSRILNLLFAAGILCFASSGIGSPLALHKQTDFSFSPVNKAIGGAFLVFAGKHGGEIKKSELNGNSVLGVEGCAKGSRIFKFTLEITKSGVLTTMQADSNVLTSEMMAKLKSLSPGDSFEFKEMKAYMPNGKDVVDVHGQKFVVV